MQAAGTKAQLVSDRVVFEVFVLPTSLDLLFRQLYSAFDQIFVVFFAFFSICLLFCHIEVIEVETLVIIQDFLPHRTPLLSMLLEITAVSYC